MKKSVKTLKAVALAGLASMALATPVLAVEDGSTVEVGDEYSVYGYSLDATQKQNTKAILGAGNVLPENEFVMTPENYVGIFGGSAGGVGNIYSSAHIAYEESGTGVNVNIKTPENITQVSETDYINAAITSGMKDATISVGSQSVVTGEGALAGIFLVQSETGQDVDPEVAQLATEELALNNELGNEVDSENPEAGTEETDALTNGILADIKNEVAKLAQENNGEIADNDARDIVINIVNNYGLTLSDATIQKLIDFAKAFSQTDISLDPEMQEQLAQLGTSLKEKGGDIWDGIQTTLADPDVQESAGNLWDSIVNFFSNLFSSFTSEDTTKGVQ